MDEQRNELPEEAEQPEKNGWQQTKEGWYDKIPLTLKQLDIIVIVCWVLLGLTAIAIALEALGVYSFFS